MVVLHICFNIDTQEIIDIYVDFFAYETYLTYSFVGAFKYNHHQWCWDLPRKRKMEKISKFFYEEI